MLAKLALCKSVVLHQRTVGRTNVGAAAALHTKHHLVFFKSAYAVLLVFEVKGF